MKNLIEIIKEKNLTLFTYGIICLMLSILCLILSKTTHTQVLGINAWIKPFKFCISATIFAYTMAYYMQFLNNQKQVNIYNWSLIILLSIEILLIIYQASKGQKSHFNQDNFNGKIIFSIMVFAITVFMLHTSFITMIFFVQKKFNATEPAILAIKLGLIITIIFAFEGYLMGSIMKHTVGSEDGGKGIPILNWSLNHGDLRIAHFFGLHAMQIIPILSYYLSKNQKGVIIISALYFLFVTFTLLYALKGNSIFKT